MFVFLKILLTFAPPNTGELAEWSMAAVLKTVELKGSGGSNPSLSALCKASQVPHVSAAFVFVGPPVESSLS